MNRFRKAINAIFAVAMLGGLSYCSYNFASAESRVRAICSQIRPGMPVAQLREFVARHGLSPQPRESGTSHVVETKTFGRFGCKVIAEAGFVKEAEYTFAD